MKKDIWYLVHDEKGYGIGEAIPTMNRAIEIARKANGYCVKKYIDNEEGSVCQGVVWTRKPETYWCSIPTGAVYAFEDGWVPKYDGWKPVHEETFIAYCEKIGVWR